MKLVIQQARAEDGAAIARIYEPYVRHTPITFEETPPSAGEMAGRISQTLVLFPYLVGEIDGHLVGYAYASPHRLRASYRWSVDVAVYLDSAHHRRGIGRMLYGQLLPQLAAQGYVMAYAGVTLPNAASIGLHESIGFKRVGVYKNVGYKAGAWRDVGWWERQLIDPLPAAPAEPIAWNSMPGFSGIESTVM